MANGTNGNGTTREAMERAAESVAMKFFARLMMVAGLPLIGSAIIGAGAWFASKVITATDENTKAIIKIETTIAPILKAHDAMATQIENNRAATSALETRVNIHAGRLGDINERNRDQDVKIDDLQRRVWGAPASPPPAMAPTPPAPREPFEPYPPAGRPR